VAQKNTAGRPRKAAPAPAGRAKKAAPAPPPPAPGPDLAKLLPYVGLAVAFWATLPQWSGPKLSVSNSKEVADHVIPGIAVLLASLVGIYASRRPQGPGALRFMGGLAVLLAGLWMMATHIPLVAQTARGGDDAGTWAATIYHFSSALAVFGLGLLWATVTWSEAGDEAQPAPARAGGAKANNAKAKK
jgi:hypothetical protein